MATNSTPTITKYEGNGNNDGTTLGNTAAALVSLYAKTPIAQQTAPTIVLAVDPTVSGSALVASIHSIAVYSASTVNKVVLALSNIGIYL